MLRKFETEESDGLVDCNKAGMIKTMPVAENIFKSFFWTNTVFNFPALFPDKIEKIK